MAYPRWLAKINKRLFNPGQVRKGRYPVVTHVGRRSGTTYQTPLDAFPTTTGFVLVARYGPESDWVRNVLAAGEATLRVDGTEHLLDSPRLVGLDEALDALTTAEPPKDFARADDFLLMDRGAADSSGVRPALSAADRQIRS
jgi:deazaflavin-dependent oxidoreductase (nitroreductase family)